MRRFYLIARDLHLYFGLFISPFVLLFAVSVFDLVHGLPDREARTASEETRTVSGISIPAGAAGLQGRARVEALRPLLRQLGVEGEVDFIRHVAHEHRLVMPVRLPGRETTVDLDYQRGTARISIRNESFGDGAMFLHKMPGPHNSNVRGNSSFMRAWRVLTDATVYLLLFLTLSGIYLWLALKAERTIGVTLLLAGAFSFFGIIYVIVRQ